MQTPTKLRRYILIGLLSSIAIFAATWVAAGETEADIWERLFAFSVSLVASAVWWVVLARVAESDLRSVIAREREVLLAELRPRVVAEGDIPDRVYGPHERHDLHFNHDLTNDLRHSSIYRFRGTTGVWVGARLSLVERGTKLTRVEVKIIDPKAKEPMMDLAVPERRRRPDNENKNAEQLEREIQDDIYMAVIGLFDARKRAREIMIAHDARYVSHRTEQFEDAMYDASVLSRDEQQFVRTSRWRHDQATYQVLKPEMQTFHEMLLKVTFRQHHTEDVLLAHLSRLGMPENRLEPLRQRYRQEYVEELRPVLAAAADFTEIYEPPAADSAL